jgi:hypothetical protein
MRMEFFLPQSSSFYAAGVLQAEVQIVGPGLTAEADGIPQEKGSLICLDCTG